MLTADETAIAEIEREMASAQAVEGVTRTWDDNVVYYDIQPHNIIVGKAAVVGVNPTNVTPGAIRMTQV